MNLFMQLLSTLLFTFGLHCIICIYDYDKQDKTPIRFLKIFIGAITYIVLMCYVNS